MATVDILQQNADEDDEKQRDLEHEHLTDQSPIPQKQHEDWILSKTGLATRMELCQLTKLDLPNCGLTSLPECMDVLLPHLEILFCPQNDFEELPVVIGQCPNLRMVSFKECHSIQRIPPQALQPQLQWLILTGNRIQELPDTIGRCSKLQKCMLSGNQIQRLPDSISNLKHLELIRLACNRLQEPPMGLLEQCPNLRWAGFASNPFIETYKARRLAEGAAFSRALPLLNDPILEDTEKGAILGQGAGGITRKVLYLGRPVAVKTFVGHLTSDGSPQDEKDISIAAACLKDDALIAVLGATSRKGALVMEYLDGYQALAGPPSFVTCSRDAYDEDIAEVVSPQFAWFIVVELLRVLFKLHTIGICHADFYAHNILINPKAEKVKLSDFGAAFFYDTSSQYGPSIQRMEVRAYAVLVQEMYDLIIVASTKYATIGAQDLENWEALLRQCQKPGATFEELATSFLRGPEQSPFK